MMTRNHALLALMLIPLLPQQAQCQASRQAQSRAASVQSGGADLSLTTVTRENLQQAIARAGADVAKHPGSSVTIRLPSGTFDLSGGEAAVNVSGINACPGRLSIVGQGAARTTLIKGNDTFGVLGRGASCITFANLTFLQPRLEVTQGTVVAATDQEVTVDITPGFPEPGELMKGRELRDRAGRPRYWLKRYTLTPSGPQLVNGEADVRWLTAEKVAGAPNRWRLAVSSWRGTPVYRSGQYVGLKMKSGGQAYRFTNGRDITFQGVRWQNDARGKFLSVDNVRIENSTIQPAAPINGVRFAMSTSGGGPQISEGTGAVVENNVFEATGDDSIGLFNTSAIVRNNRISDATRGILIVGSADVRLEGNVLNRAPLRRKTEDKRARRQAANDN